MRYLVLFQGGYYFVTAMWPLVHLPSFERITGDKQDHWLVYTVSLMILASALVLLYASLITSAIVPEVKILSISNCSFLMFVSTYFSLKGVIRKIYLAHASVEFFILSGVLYGEFRH